MPMTLPQMLQQLDAPGVAEIYLDGAAITVSDATADPAGPFRALWVGAAGAVKLTTPAGNSITLPAVPAGTVLPIACTRVWSTGTGVTTPNTNIVGLR